MKKIILYSLFLLALVSCKKNKSDLFKENSIQYWNEVELVLPNSEIVKAEVVNDKITILYVNGLIQIGNDFTISSNVTFNSSNQVMTDPYPVFSDNFYAFAKQSDDSIGTQEVLVFSMLNPSSQLLALNTQVVNGYLPTGSEVCAFTSNKALFHFQDRVTQTDKLFAYRVYSESLVFDKELKATVETDTLGYLKKVTSLNSIFYISDSDETVKITDSYESVKIFDGTIFDIPYEFRDSIYISTISQKYCSEDKGETWEMNLKNIEMHIYPLKITSEELYYRNFESAQLCDERDVIYKTYDLDNSIPFVPNNNNECYTIIGIMGNKLVTIKGNKLYYMELTE